MLWVRISNALLIDIKEFSGTIFLKGKAERADQGNIFDFLASYLLICASFGTRANPIPDP